MEPNSVAVRRWSWLTSWIPRTGLPNPGKYEEYNREARTILSDQEVFDGVKVEYTKSVTPSMHMSHTIEMGAQDEPPAYRFSPAYVYGGTTLAGRCGSDGVVFGRFIHKATDDLTFNVSAQTSLTNDNATGMNAEVELKGHDWYSTARYNLPGTYTLSYMQSLTQRVAMGAELLYSHYQGASMWSTGFRYDAQRYVVSGQAMPLAGNLTLSYSHKVGDRTNLASEWTAAVHPQTGQLDTYCSVGWLYAFRMSQVRGHVTTKGRIFANYDEALNENMRYSISGDIDYSKGVYRFGLGCILQF